MHLIMKKNNEILLSIPLDNFNFDQILFGSDKVKEISFIKTLKNSDELYFNQLKQKIESSDYLEATSTIIFYSENIYFSYNVPIKTILYRTQGYMRDREFEMQENLSIRFIEDNFFIIDKNNNFVFCDKEKCLHFKENYCSKYKVSLDKKINNNFLICKQCFLETTPSIKNNFYNEFYHNMEKNYQLFNEK